MDVNWWPSVLKWYVADDVYARTARLTVTNERRLKHLLLRGPGKTSLRTFNFKGQNTSMRTLMPMPTLQFLPRFQISAQP